MRKHPEKLLVGELGFAWRLLALAGGVAVLAYRIAGFSGISSPGPFPGHQCHPAAVGRLHPRRHPAQAIGRRLRLARRHAAILPAAFPPAHPGLHRAGGGLSGQHPVGQLLRQHLRLPAYVPMLTLGIPGDAVTAVIIGALVIHGLNPGPMLMVESPHIFWFTVGNLVLANLFLLVFGLMGIKLFAKLVEMPKAMLIPLILVL
ncbi:tripartite tricarboxylate transporter permease [Azotobacter sp. CWF10]